MKDVFRIGSVQSVNEGCHTARVKYTEYDGMISPELKIINHAGDWWRLEIGDDVLCICPPDGDGDGYIVGRI